MKKRKSPPPVIQPLKCRSCLWGRWQDTVQICSRVRCVKGEEVVNGDNQATSSTRTASSAKSART